MQDTFTRAAAFRAARERNYAVGAGLVAALNDGDVGPVRIVAARKRRIECLVRIQAQPGDAAISLLQLYQHLRQFGVAGGPGHQADVGSTIENRFALLLCDAAKNSEYFALPGAFELIEAVKYFLLCFVADAAGVVEDQLSILRLGTCE